eukprot:5781085-Amphidinium_carterae.1
MSVRQESTAPAQQPRGVEPEAWTLRGDSLQRSWLGHASLRPRVRASQTQMVGARSWRVNNILEVRHEIGPTTSTPRT